MISIDDFAKVEITVGKILSAEKVEGSEKLLRLSVDFAEESPRQVISGIAKWYPEPEVLLGRKVPFVTNLEPRTIMGLESQAMIMAAKASETDAFSLLEVGESIPAGTRVS
jgi:methionyl-tRNA synthetase